MRLLDRFGLAQRVVLVIGLGFACLAVGKFIISLGDQTQEYFGYAPLSNSAYFPQLGLRPWVQLVIWLVLITIWSTVSMSVLKHQEGRS